MIEFIFYTDEGCTSSPDGTELENLQILGIAKGESKKCALENLMDENPWIDKTGFDIKRIFARQLAKA